MATTSTSTVVGAVESVFTEPEQLALAGFLAGYTGLTREAYALDLRQFASWCQQHHIGLFQARRADIECFAVRAERHRGDRDGLASGGRRLGGGQPHVTAALCRRRRSAACRWG